MLFSLLIIPDEIVFNNWPQFASREFAEFAEFVHLNGIKRTSLLPQTTLHQWCDREIHKNC